MNFTRREMLQGISAGAIGIAANSSLPGAKAIWTTSESSVPWPKPMGDPVIESLRPVIEHSRDVHTHYEKIVEVAGWLAYEDLPLPNLAVPFGMEKTPDVAIDFIMVGTVIDTAFTDFKTHVKFQMDYAGEHHSDSDALFACMKRRWTTASRFSTGKYLAKMTRADMEKFSPETLNYPCLTRSWGCCTKQGALWR